MGLEWNGEPPGWGNSKKWKFQKLETENRTGNEETTLARQTDANEGNKEYVRNKEKENKDYEKKSINSICI